MKANINEKPFRGYSRLPKTYAARPNTLNYDKLEEVELAADGWREIVTPPFNQESQKLGAIYFDDEADVFTYEVAEKTDEEILGAFRVYEIKPSQGKILLHRLGLLEQVNQMISQSTDVELSLFWEYALTWELENNYILSLGLVLGMQKEDVEDFFIEAAKIN